MKVDADGGIVDHGSNTSSINPAGFKIHSAIHLSSRAADWIMHFHVPEVNAIANLKDGLIRGLSVYSMDLGGISYHDFEHATSGSDVCARMVSDLGPKNKVLMLPNHGAITIGGSVHEAFYLTYQLVQACKVQILTQSCSRSNSDILIVDEETVEQTYQIVQNNYTGNEFGKMEWDAAKRKMEAEQDLATRLVSAFSYPLVILLLSLTILVPEAFAGLREVVVSHTDEKGVSNCIV